MIFGDPALGRLFVLRIGGQVAGMANALITISSVEGGDSVPLFNRVLAFAGTTKQNKSAYS